jgi:hypothetical protein
MAYHMLPATSLTIILNPRYWIFMASYDVCMACHMLPATSLAPILNPRYLIYMASYDVVSNI